MAAPKAPAEDAKPAPQKFFGFLGPKAESQKPAEPPASKAAEKSNITSIRTPQVSLFVRPHAVR